MHGAILGDIVGSPYEFDKGKKVKDFGPLFSDHCGFTDDTVMTIAVAEGLLNAGLNASVDVIKNEVIKSMKWRGRKIPNAGYGGRFRQWLFSDSNEPYGSFGNGSAMRVSAAGLLYETI